MPIYLSEYIGAGTHRDPFRPRGSEQPGWSAIDLRADGGATLAGNGLRYCLLSLPAPDADARLYKLADGLGENVPLLVRAGLAARLNATLNYTRFDDLIADLLLRPPTNAWKPLRDTPTRPLGIYLGGALSPRPELRSLAAQLYSETWTAADSGSLTADLTWTEYIGTSWAISGNRARLAGNVGSNHARADHDTDTDDQIASVTLATFTHGGGNSYALLECRHDSSADETLYALSAVNDTTPLNEWQLEKAVVGSYTTLASQATAPAASDVMRVSVVDNVLRGDINTDTLVIGPVTDTAITGNTRAGMGSYIDNAGTVVEFDNWAVQDYVYTARPLLTVISPLRW